MLRATPATAAADPARSPAAERPSLCLPVGAGDAAAGQRRAP
jgi:hypothetical protein